MSTAWEWLTTNGVGQNIAASLIWAPLAFGVSHSVSAARERRAHAHLRAEMKQQHEMTRREIADVIGGDEPASAPLKKP